MTKESKLYEKMRKGLIRQHTKKGRLSPLGKWELAKLYMMYYPDKQIEECDYHE